MQVTNVSNDLGVLMLAGPKSRDILSQTTAASLDNASFRWLTGQIIEVAGANVRALRVSYTGELGWELHLPLADMPAVYEDLVKAGEGHGLIHLGSAALNCLRMEKAYRSDSELTNEVTLAEVGLLQSRKSRLRNCQHLSQRAGSISHWKTVVQRGTR